MRELVLFFVLIISSLTCIAQDKGTYYISESSLFYLTETKVPNIKVHKGQSSKIVFHKETIGIYIDGYCVDVIAYDKDDILQSDKEAYILGESAISKLKRGVIIKQIEKGVYQLLLERSENVYDLFKYQ